MVTTVGAWPWCVAALVVGTSVGCNAILGVDEDYYVGTTTSSNGAGGTGAQAPGGHGGAGNAGGLGGSGATGGGNTGGCGGGEETGDAVARCATGITVDGVLDEPAWCGPSQVIDKVVLGTHEGVEASFRVRWDETYWYLGVEVVDSALRCDSPLGNCWGCNDDAVEMYFDSGHVGGVFNGSDHRQYFLRWSIDDVVERNDHNQGALLATTDSQQGFILEFAVPWTTLGATPSSATVYGFDVAVDYDQDGGDREGQLMWYGTAQNYLNADYWGSASVLDCR